MSERIKNKLNVLTVGCVTTLWDLLVWRVSKNGWVVGHCSINTKQHTTLTLDEAAVEIEKLMD